MKGAVWALGKEGSGGVVGSSRACPWVGQGGRRVSKKLVATSSLPHGGTQWQHSTIKEEREK